MSGQVILGGLVAGLSTGSILAIVGMAFAILYSSTGVLSLALGDFMVVSAIVYFESHSLGPIPAAVLAVAVTGVAGLASYLLVFRSLAGEDPTTTSIATIALGSLVGAIVLFFFTNIVTIPSNLGRSAFQASSLVDVSRYDVVTVLAALILCAALIALLRFTPLGLQLRAMADDGYAAS
jgi:branched-subunit amino acid ABC-type transport system permease component